MESKSFFFPRGSVDVPPKQISAICSWGLSTGAAARFEGRWCNSF